MDRETQELRLGMVQVAAFAAELFFAVSDKVEDQAKQKLVDQFENTLKPAIGRLIQGAHEAGGDAETELAGLLDDLGMYSLVEQYRPRT